ncbi:hypothetical protein F183_A11690 [Bryobacterales bacterium F-183]|nr:hypothetical protein F183_A11690 [Bryobacterales bacterium F-183]
MQPQADPPIIFPPYGGMDHTFGTPSQLPEPKPTFQPASAWPVWMDKIVKVLNECLWPSWDHANRTWAASATNGPHMAAITRADFEIFAAMGVERGLDERPKSPNAGADLPTHRVLFQIEDSGSGHPLFKQIGSYYGRYDTTLKKEVADLMPSSLIKNADRIFPANARIKFLLQRPRPYQMSLLMPGIPPFPYLRATTALSPSACSGHTLYGLIGVAGVVDDWIDECVKLTQSNHECLQQFAVDIGDRRVMAGVHYPGDNLSSWIIALAMSDYLFRPHVRHWIREAIERSAVYQLVKAAGGPYTKALQKLDEIATNGFPV